MKTLELSGEFALNSPGVKNNSENSNNLINANGENGQSISQSVVENEDSDDWYNESAI